jgi:hypothetical protein
MIAAGLAALCLVLLFSTLAVGRADLVVTGLALEPEEPLPGTAVDVTAVVENTGSGDAVSQFFVVFEMNGVRHGSVAVNGGLRAGGDATVSTTWIAEEGTHRIEVFADHPFDHIAEDDETNNAAQFEIRVPSTAEIAARVGNVRIAVAQILDHSESGWVNVAEGVADKLSERLDAAGVRTVPWAEMSEAMQRRGLNPYSSIDTAEAARLLGADLLLTGSVDALVTQEFSLGLGLITIRHSTASAVLSAEAFPVSAAQPLFSLTAEGQHAGATEFSVDLDALLFLSGSASLCSGGLRTDREVYHAGESVSVGYLNPASDAWYGVEIHTTTGTFLRWLEWQYVESGECSVWYWDQRDSFGTQLSPGVYFAKLWDGSSHVATATIQIEPGWSLFPSFDEITVGSLGFEESVVGIAINRAVDRLVSEVVRALEAEAPTFARSEVPVLLGEGVGSEGRPIEGQVAAILPDGRLAVNVGSASGVARGDFFEVLDPADSSVRGEIMIVEVRDAVSYALPVAPFDVAIGDIVRRAEP